MPYAEGEKIYDEQVETCPRCGWVYRKVEMLFEERTDQYVCPECYDPPHPVVDDIADNFELGVDY